MICKFNAAAYLRTITGEITQHATVKKLKIRSLFADIRPLRPPEAANSGPMVGFQLLHSVEKDVKRDSEEFMSDDDIRVGFVCRD
jgi:hypothetical protein